MTYIGVMVPDAGSLIREARSRHGVSQEALARRARTTQKQISRIEGGEISPSVFTLSRLLAAMGERLELRAVPGQQDNRSDDELRADFEQLSASERIAQTAALSRTLTGIAAGGADHGPPAASGSPDSTTSSP
jgi:transcriptional regulator with XRE-family HTH domain